MTMKVKVSKYKHVDLVSFESNEVFFKTLIFLYLKVTFSSKYFRFITDNFKNTEEKLEIKLIQ